MAEGYSRKQSYELLRSQLMIERSSFLTTWRDSGDYILPRRPRFFVSDVNKGDRRTRNIVDSTATMAAGTLRSGMMAGVTSPARPWFRLTTSDPDLADDGAVKQWLHLVTQRMNTVFLRSNLYNVLPIVYGDMGVFGTGCIFMEEDLEHVVRFYPFAIGSYMLAQDERLKVQVFVRDFRMTIRQLIGKFAIKDASGQVTNWENFSTHVKSLYTKGEMESWVDVCHVVRPNENYDSKKHDAKFKKFSSCYYERGNSSSGQLPNYDSIQQDIFLRESGYDFFPVLAPRWEVTGEDVYGTACPSVTALGDIRALQTLQKRKSEAIEKMVRPPMVAPPSMKNQKSSILPGDVTYVTDVNGQSFRPAMMVEPKVQELLMDVADHQKRISRAFFEDLFLMLSQSDRRDITAREIDERHEEKLLALGPVLEQLNQDLLDPLIDNTFDVMVMRGDVPPAPQELQGQPLKVDYTSIMAQAQKIVNVSGLSNFAGFIGQVAQFKPEILDKVDVDEMADVYGDSLGIPPKVIVPSEQAQAARAQRQQAQQQQMQMQQMQAAAQNVKALGQAKVGQGSALDGLVQESTAGQIA